MRKQCRLFTGCGGLYTSSRLLVAPMQRVLWIGHAGSIQFFTCRYLYKLIKRFENDTRVLPWGGLEQCNVYVKVFYIQLGKFVS